MFVGIDSHKDVLVAAVVDQVGRVGDVASFENHRDGFCEIVRVVAQPSKGRAGGRGVLGQLRPSEPR